MRGALLLFSCLFGVLGGLFIYFSVEYRILSFIGNYHIFVCIGLGAVLPLLVSAWFYSKKSLRNVGYGRAFLNLLLTSFFVLLSLSICLYIRAEIHQNWIYTFFSDILYGAMYAGPFLVGSSLVFAAFFRNSKVEKKLDDNLLDDIDLEDG